MISSAIAAALVDALTAAADRETGEETALVSVSIEMLAPEEGGAIATSVVRKTRTLVFMSAELRGKANTLIAAASSVHKVAARD